MARRCFHEFSQLIYLVAIPVPPSEWEAFSKFLAGVGLERTVSLFRATSRTWHGSFARVPAVTRREGLNCRASVTAHPSSESAT